MKRPVTNGACVFTSLSIKYLILKIAETVSESSETTY